MLIYEVFQCWQILFEECEDCVLKQDIDYEIIYEIRKMEKSYEKILY